MYGLTAPLCVFIKEVGFMLLQGSLEASLSPGLQYVLSILHTTATSLIQPGKGM